MNNSILLIETATDTCSAAITDGFRIISACRTSVPKSQASGLAPMIQTVMNEAGISANGLSAVAVSSGPGSYTGLRVGVSTAKGICFGAGLPLIAVETLEILACGVLKEAENTADTLIVPMIDARRMEVYTALYNSSGQRISPVTGQKNTDRSSIPSICTNAHSRPSIPMPYIWQGRPAGHTKKNGSRM